MKRSDARKHATPRFGRHNYTAGARFQDPGTPIVGRSFFASTGFGSSEEQTRALKYGTIPKRQTFVRPRAREAKNLQDARSAS